MQPTRYAKLSERELEKRLNAADKKESEWLSKVIAAGFGNARMSELRELAGSNKVIDGFLKAADKAIELRNEARYREWFHGTRKPVRRKNPVAYVKGRRTAKKKTGRKKKRTAAQKRATANLVKLNKQRAKKKVAKKRPTKKRTAKKKTTARKSNPRRRNAFKVFRIKGGKVDFYGGVGTWGHDNNRAILFRTKADANGALSSAYSSRYQHGIAPEGATVAEIKKAVFGRVSTAGKK